jgi:WhiB family redox-sensing transcriptional regulator
MIEHQLKPPHPYDLDPRWQQTAACRGMDVNLFFPPRGTSYRTIHKIKQICNDCPIRIKCLDYALHHREKLGIWGGLSERERRQLNQQHRHDNTTNPR